MAHSGFTGTKKVNICLYICVAGLFTLRFRPQPGTTLSDCWILSFLGLNDAWNERQHMVLDRCKMLLRLPSGLIFGIENLSLSLHSVLPIILQ